MIGIILAAGNGSRVGGKIKAAFRCADGERLLDREVRMFKPFVSNLYLVTHHTHDLEHPDVVKFVPASRRWKCDTLLSTVSLWTDDILVLHGDVWWDDGAAKFIATFNSRAPTFFWDGKQEVFALKCAKRWQDDLARAVKIAVDRSNPAAPDNDCGLGSLRAICKALSIPSNTVELLNDQTMDIDTDEEYHGFIDGWRKRGKKNR